MIVRCCSLVSGRGTSLPSTALSAHSQVSARIEENMAERVGFEKALSDRLFAFNKMLKTDVFTVTYLLSHLEHESQKKR